MGIETLERTSDVTFRVLFSLIFLIAGLGHFVERDLMLARLEQAPLGYLASFAGSPELLMPLSGMALVVCGAALLLGFKVRVAAGLLFLTLIPITVTTHLGNPGHVGPFFKNVALMGGLLHFAVRGGGAYGIDTRRLMPKQIQVHG
jgi:putative oxidoreductase